LNSGRRGENGAALGDGFDLDSTKRPLEREAFAMQNADTSENKLNFKALNQFETKTNINLTSN
jgi:hypothetical protein